jgi:hypothetical protein
MLASYTDAEGARHELMAWGGAASSTLVVDHELSRRAAPRLVAHLAADEPAENAMVLCEEYLPRARTGVCRFRELEPEDLCRPPALESRGQREASHEQVRVSGSRCSGGEVFMLAPQRSSGSLPQLRWWRLEAGMRRAAVSLREAVGALEDYEPVRALTEAAIERARPGDGLSRSTLRAELARVQRSPIILNRALREAVLASVRGGGLSMSEIAIRCGRVKHDSRGNESGETSWLARRLGLLPEGGQSTPTPWVHSEVLGLIARQGLGMAPREVEL